MLTRRPVLAVRVTTEIERRDVLEVLRAIYCEEKHWVEDAGSIFPEEDLHRPTLSWFVVYRRGEPAGVLRVLYDLPLDLYEHYAFEPLDESVDLRDFFAQNKTAEIGRFAVLPRFRHHIAVVSRLMWEATRDTIQRGCTHYVTDVFEGEVNSPYGFHTRVVGFRPVASHAKGEINCPNRRITLILDLREAYRKLQRRENRFYRSITMEWDENLHRLLSRA